MTFKNINKILVQDLQASLDVIEEDKLTLFNIYANRVVSNLFFGEKENLIIFGFVLKELHNRLNMIQNSRAKTIYQEAKSVFIELLEPIINKVSDGEFSETDVWEFYVSGENSLRKYLLDDAEFNSYELDPEFTRYTTDRLIKLLLDNSELINNPNSRIIDGIVNEIGRVIKTHGSTARDLLIYLVLSTSLKVWEYRNYERVSIVKGKLSDDDYWTKRLTNLLNSLVKLEETQFDEGYVQANDLIKAYGGEWRIYYIKYRDLFREVAFRPAVPILDKDERQELVDSITSMIEKEV